MRGLKVLALIVAIMAGHLYLSGSPASAEPLSAASFAARAAREAQVDWAYRRGYRVRYRAYRPAYYRRAYRPVYYRRAYRPIYYPRRYVYRPRVVCRWRATRWGMRRVCYRRW